MGQNTSSLDLQSPPMGLNSSPLQNVDPRPPAPPPRSTKRKRRVDFTKLIQVNEDYDEEREWAALQAKNREVKRRFIAEWESNHKKSNKENEANPETQSKSPSLQERVPSNTAIDTVPVAAYPKESAPEYRVAKAGPTDLDLCAHEMKVKYRASGHRMESTTMEAATLEDDGGTKSTALEMPRRGAVLFNLLMFNGDRQQGSVEDIWSAISPKSEPPGDYQPWHTLTGEKRPDRDNPWERFTGQIQPILNEGCLCTVHTDHYSCEEEDSSDEAPYNDVPEAQEDSESEDAVVAGASDLVEDVGFPESRSLSLTKYKPSWDTEASSSIGDVDLVDKAASPACIKSDTGNRTPLHIQNANADPLDIVLQYD